MPRFSIIIPCRNAAATLPATLESLAAQTLPDWEALLVDDASTDATAALIAAAAAADPRIRAVTAPRRGPSAARNHAALAEAKGEILAFCDADDLWAAEKLARFDAAFADPAVSAVYARVAFFRADPDHPSTASEIAEVPLTILDLLGENPVCTMSNLAIRRAAFEATRGFDEELVQNEDLEWLVRRVGGGAVVIGIDAVLTFYRTSVSGLSADLPAMQAGRAAAVESAARYGETPDPRHEAVFLRYLSRRALRLDQRGGSALRLALAGIAASPGGFFAPPRRGALTAGGALLAPLLPGALRRILFA